MDQSWRPEPGKHLTDTTISAVFRSQVTSRWVVAISTPVFDDSKEKKFLGIVSMTIAADWPLAGDSPEALLTAAEKLQGKIVAADLAGIKPAGKRGGDNEPEEAPARTFDPYTPRAYATPAPYGSAGPAYYVPAGTTAPGMPRFVYAARLTDAQRKAALAEACAKAKTQAKELAEAAGVKLGGIASLSHNITVMSGAGGFDPNVCYPPAPGHAFGLSDDEGLNHTPGEIEFRIQVRGQFQLQ